MFVATASGERRAATSTFWGRATVATWSPAAGDKAICFPASRIIATASLAYGATATAAAASAEAGLVATASGARGEPATTSQTRGVITELPPAAGLHEMVPGVRVKSDDIRACGDGCGDVPRGRGHCDGIRRAGAATMAFRSVGCRVGGTVDNGMHRYL